MFKKSKHLLWIFLVIAVVISFVVFMVIAVPEANTIEEVQQTEEMN